MNRFLAWSRHLWLWLTPLLFCAVNLFGLAVYQAGFAGKVERLQEDRQRAADNLESLVAEYRQSQEFLRRATDRRQHVAELYTENFATTAERFSAVVTEVKTLARQAGLDPRSFQYPEEELEFGLVQRSIQFNVDGSYDQLRTFINLLELSNQFLMLDTVSLGGSTEDERNPRLSVALSVATVFAEEKVEKQMEKQVADLGDTP